MSAKKRDLIERMRENPKNDWTIADVKKLAKAHGLEVRSPSGSSHYVVSSKFLRDSLCVPHNRPIKARYITLLCLMVDAHLDAGDERKKK